MADMIRTGAHTAEIMVGGMAGGLAYATISGEVYGIEEAITIMVLFFVVTVIMYVLRWYYQRTKGEPLRG